MARTTANDDLFARLRANGLRKRTARLISEATDRRRKPAKRVERTLSDLKRLVRERDTRAGIGHARSRARPMFENLISGVSIRPSG